MFNRTDYVLVAFQYLFIQCSSLYLLFTLFYFYKPGKFVQMILICFIVFNPLFLHLSNLISSDGFFLSLSLTWFSLLLWIINKPSTKVMLWHAVILFIAFTVRYNAMIYPIIAIIAFLISKMTLKKKIISFSIVALLCGTFIGFTMYKYRKLTGYWQYSPFSGWQLTNNAMYAYRYVDSANRKPIPKKFQLLDSMVREYFDTTRDTNKHPVEKTVASTFYMWSKGLPMMKYRDSLFKEDTTASELKRWASMGPIFKDYGTYIIKLYPWHFIRHFIWPNANKYYAPPVEFLESYNSGKNFVTAETGRWFGYKSLKVRTRMKNETVWVLNFYPIQSGIINILMLFCLLFYLTLKGWNYMPLFKNAVLLGGIMWLLNAFFTISASSAALRFQSFPIVLSTIFSLLMVDWLVKVLIITKNTEKIQLHANSDIQGLRFRPNS